MTVIEGQRRTDQVDAARVHLDLRKDILLLEPNAQALTVFLNNVWGGGARKPTKTTKFRWFEDELENRWGSIDHSGGYTNSDATLDVADSSPFYPEALVKVPRTGEVLRVSSVTDSNTVVFVRSYGAAAAAALNDGEQLFVIGNAREEGDTAKAARSEDPTEVYNWTQIWRNWIHMSGSELSSDVDTTPHDWTYQKKKAGIEHAKDRELSMLFGTPGQENGTTGKVRTTGGATHFITENVMDAGGTLTEVEFENWLRPFLRYGDKKGKVVFTSRLVGSVLNSFSQGKLQTTVGDTKYGVSISRWISAHGEVKFVTHDLFEGDEYSGYALGIDFGMDNVAYRYLAGGEGPPRDTVVNPHIEQKGEDGRKDELLTEAGLQLAQPKCHGLLTGVTG